MSSANGTSDHYNPTLHSVVGSPVAMEDNFIIPAAEIRQIVIQTCRSVVGSQRYEHRKAAEWNSEIIQTVLNRLMQELHKQSVKRYKLIVNSNIAQTIGSGSESAGERSSTRGLHVANAAYWDPPYDGMFSYKYSSDRDRDFDIIVSIVWLSHDGYTPPAPEPEHLEGRPPHVVA